MARKQGAAPVETPEEAPPWDNDFPAWDLEPLTAEEEQLAWQWYYETEETARLIEARRTEER